MNRSLPGTKKIQIYSSDGTSEYPGVNVMSSKTIGALFSLRLLNGGLACAKDSRGQQRDKVRKMAATTLTDLYKIQAEARTAIQNSAGYAVFDNLGTNLLLGAGVAVNSKTGQDTFMKMTSSVGVGLGVGVNDCRMVFVVRDRAGADPVHRIRLVWCNTSRRRSQDRKVGPELARKPRVPRREYGCTGSLRRASHFS
jgi:hypothetical protein